MGWRKALRLSGSLLVVAPLGLLAYGLLRPSAPYPPGVLDVETWPVTSDSSHNSNTDLLAWHGKIWLVHARAPWHFASRGTRLDLKTSDDGRAFVSVASFSCLGEDIRDPKLQVFGDELHLYWLCNHHFPEPQPYTTMVSSSKDGRHWAPPAEVDPKGWLLWRPKTFDGVTFFVTAYWNEHGRAALLRSTDGRRWEKVSDIFEGSSTDETDMEFMDDGEILSTSRLEGADHDSWFGDEDGATLISVASPPYTHWEQRRDTSARLDGPCLFRFRGSILALGRYEPARGRRPFATGSILSRKRTALYSVSPSGLRLLGFLPSGGDTSYPGVAPFGEGLLVSYYTSPTSLDYPWILGMLRPSEIRMAWMRGALLDSLLPREDVGASR